MNRRELLVGLFALPFVGSVAFKVAEKLYSKKKIEELLLERMALTEQKMIDNLARSLYGPTVSDDEDGLSGLIGEE